MSEVRREPILRLMPAPSDINANGHIFGGWILSQMDKAAGVVARLHSGGRGCNDCDRPEWSSFHRSTCAT